MALSETAARVQNYNNNNINYVYEFLNLIPLVEY